MFRFAKMILMASLVFGIFYGMSNNELRWVDLEYAREAIGFVPEKGKRQIRYQVLAFFHHWLRHPWHFAQMYPPRFFFLHLIPMRRRVCGAACAAMVTGSGGW